MERTEAQNSTPQGRYTLLPSRYSSEDILFCIDVDTESLVEMKVTGPNGRPITRLDSIKQAILLFINAKLSINPDHRFAFATLAKSASWVPLISLDFQFQSMFGTLIFVGICGITKRIRKFYLISDFY